VRRSKLSERTFCNLTTSVGLISSSALSMTMPRSEYSRMDWTFNRLVGLLGPFKTKAMILKPSGSTIALAICPMGPAACMLRTGVPMSLVL